MRNRWIGLALAAAMMASAAPVYAQYLVRPTEAPAPALEPIPFGPSTANGPPAPPGPPAEMAGSSGNSLPGDLPNASSPPQLSPERNSFYFSAEYLLWWFRPDSSSNILITSSANPNLATDVGALFQPNTTLLFGGNTLPQGSASGVRATAGYAPSWFLPIEVSGFFLHTGHTTVLSSDGTGNPLLVRPIFAIQPALFQEVIFGASLPGVTSGSAGVVSSTTLFGAEANIIVCSVIKDPEFTKWTLDAAVGGRYAALNEDLNVFNATSVLTPIATLNFNTATFGPGFATSASDVFNTRNQFGGAQLGLRASYPLGGCNLELKGSSALGINHEIVGVYGASALYAIPAARPSVPQPPTLVSVVPGGVQAVASNSGRFVRSNRFSTVEEFSVSLGLPILETLQLSVGYNLFYWSNVVRPGNQVNRFVDTTQVPTDASYNPNSTATQPPFLFQSTNFWAQGLTLSLALTF